MGDLVVLHGFGYDHPHRVLLNERAVLSSRTDTVSGCWHVAVPAEPLKAVVMAPDVGNAEWVRRGLCSCAKDTPLTAWKEPELLQPLESRAQRFRATNSGADDAAGRTRNPPPQLLAERRFVNDIFCLGTEMRQ